MALYTYNKQQFNSDISVNNANTEFISTNHINISGGVINVFGPSTHTDNIYLSTDNTFSVGMKDPNTSYFGYGTNTGNANINVDTSGNTNINGSGKLYVNTTGGMNITGGFTSLMYVTTKTLSFSPKVSSTPSLSDLINTRQGLIKFIGKISNGGLIQLYIIDSVTGLSQKKYGMGTYVNICCNARDTSQPSLQFYGMSRESGSLGFSQYKFYYYSDTLSNTWIWFADYTTNNDFRTDNNVTYTIRIYSNNPANFYPDATDGSAYLNSAKEITNGIYTLDNRIGINKTTPATGMALDVCGNAYINGNTTIGNGFTVKYANDTLPALNVDPTSGILNVNNTLTLSNGLQVNYNNNTTQGFSVDGTTGNTTVNNSLSVTGTIQSAGLVQTSFANVTLTYKNDFTLVGAQYFGGSVSVTSDGSIVAISDPAYNGTRGRIIIYYSVNGEWSPSNTIIDSTVQFQAIGTSLSLSGNGNVLVVGANGNAPTYIYAYRMDSSTGKFNTTSQTIYTKNANSNIVNCVVSYDGNTVIVCVVESSVFYAYVYSYSNGTWSNIQSLNNGFSNSLIKGCISGDGNTVIVSKCNFASTNGYKGQLYVYSRSGFGLTYTDVTQSGFSLETVDNNYYGYSMSLDYNGNTLAVSDYLHNNVYVYTRSGNTFTLIPQGVLSMTSVSDFGGVISLSGNGNILSVNAYTSNHAYSTYIYSRNGTTFTLLSSMPYIYNSTVITGNINQLNSVANSNDGSTIIIGYSGLNKAAILSLNQNPIVYTGIGNSNPSYLLDVGGNTNVGGNLTVSGNINVPNNKYISFGSGKKPNKLILYGNDDSNAFSLGIDDATLMYNVQSGCVHRFYGGNVGIGISPSYTLDVNGTARISSDTTINGKMYFSGSLSSNNGINLPTGGSGITWGNSYSRIMDDGHLRICTDDNLYLHTGLRSNTLGSERLTILEDGRVGIGMTPSLSYP